MMYSEQLMSVFAILLCLILPFVSPKECEEGEFLMLGDLAQERTCKNPNPGYTFIFDATCVCRQDHVRNDDGRCVPEEICNSMCPENSFYEECSGKQKQRCIHLKDPTPDNTKCEGGCTCKPGYFWTGNGDECVTYLKCRFPDGRRMQID